MKLLKIKGYQVFANYRKPMSYNFWDTYPLPPPSTIRGWFHTTVKATDYIPMSVSIHGSFESIVYDLQRLIKFDRKDRVKKGYPVLEAFNKTLNYTPTYVANLYNINLTIYIKAQEDHLKSFIDNVFSIEYPWLGRKEDIIRIDYIDLIEVKERHFNDLDIYSIKEGMYMNQDVVKKLRPALLGTYYRLNFKYDKELSSKTSIRYFEKKDVVYLDSGIIENGTFLYDETDDKIVDLIGD